MMRDCKAFVEPVRQSVSAYRAGIALGLNPDRYGRCACPVHKGKDRNCKLWKDDRGWYCYVCKQGGDVIRLVERVRQCSFPDAVAWLNGAFGLNLPVDAGYDEEGRERAEKAAKLRRLERELSSEIRMEQFRTYADAGALVNRLERDKETYRPRRASEEWDPRFVNALRTLAEAREIAVDAAMAVIGVKE